MSDDFTYFYTNFKRNIEDFGRYDDVFSHIVAYFQLCKDNNYPSYGELRWILVYLKYDEIYQLGVIKHPIVSELLERYEGHIMNTRINEFMIEEFIRFNCEANLLK